MGGALYKLARLVSIRESRVVYMSSHISELWFMYVFCGANRDFLLLTIFLFFSLVTHDHWPGCVWITKKRKLLITEISTSFGIGSVEY